MWDYRKHMSKGECLFNAILWAVMPFLWLIIAVYLWMKDGDFDYFPIVAIYVLASVFHWCRYLRYDKKTKEDIEEK